MKHAIAQMRPFIDRDPSGVIGNVKDFQKYDEKYTTASYSVKESPEKKIQNTHLYGFHYD